MSEEEYIGIVGEIFDGYTELNYFGTPVYLKHFSIRDQRYIHRFYEKYKSIASSRGIPQEKEMLLQLRNDGLWSDEDDLKIINLESEIESLKQTKKSLSLPSQKESFQKDIDEKTQELFKIKLNRKEIVGKTAEDYGSSRSNEEFIRYIIYKDPELKDHLFTDEEFINLDDDKIAELLNQYSKCTNKLTEDVIQECVLRDFFNMYLSQTEDISAFYGKPIIHLSVFQLKLAIYARIFSNIFQYHDDVPDSIKKDPSALLRFAESKKTSKEGRSSSRDTDGGATAVFGATREDLEFVDSNAKKISLSDELAKQGGVMDMEQLMKLMG